jgi:RNA polymerase sigma-70 factor, ECF subfamily
VSGWHPGEAARFVHLGPVAAVLLAALQRPVHATHADMLRRAGDPTAAAAAYRRAIALSANAVERTELLRRLHGLAG